MVDYLLCTCMWVWLGVCWLVVGVSEDGAGSGTPRDDYPPTVERSRASTCPATNPNHPHHRTIRTIRTLIKK